MNPLTERKEHIMTFIKLTALKTGRTFHVRADAITAIHEKHNDDKGERGTNVVLFGNDSMIVCETDEEILRLVQDANTTN